VSDRATALNFWAMARRQVCWAHYADIRIMPPLFVGPSILTGFVPILHL